MGHKPFGFWGFVIYIAISMSLNRSPSDDKGMVLGITEPPWPRMDLRRSETIEHRIEKLGLFPVYLILKPKLYIYWRTLSKRQFHSTHLFEWRSTNLKGVAPVKKYLDHVQTQKKSGISFQYRAPFLWRQNEVNLVLNGLMSSP